MNTNKKIKKSLSFVVLTAFLVTQTFPVSIQNLTGVLYAQGLEPVGVSDAGSNVPTIPLDHADSSISENHSSSVMPSSSPMPSDLTISPVNGGTHLDEHAELHKAVEKAEEDYRVATGGHFHTADPAAIQEEHEAVFNLIRYHDVTHAIVKSGNWSDESIWADGKIANKDANVLIALKDADGNAITVTVDDVIETTFRTIRVDGHLRFATDKDTGLKVDTMVVSVTGHLEMGTEANPIKGDVEAKLVIADRGDIDITWDPRELSRGLISHGRVTIRGEEKTEQLDLAMPALKGQKKLVLSGVPTNWKVGDVLIVPATASSGNQDEEVLIDRIQNGEVYLAGFNENGTPNKNWKGLKFNHTLPQDMSAFVINLSRNVVIESENVGCANVSACSNLTMGINRRRGHIMFMHGAQSKTNVQYLGVYGMGRTDKRTPLESPEFDAQGNRIPDTGHNTVGRYAFHFHRGGTDKAPAIVRGLAIVDSPGLGLVNHSSNVIVENSVAYNVVGSAWFTEVGDEVGVFRNVTAVRMTGSGEDIESRTNMSAGVHGEIDFGHSGHGFWLQGGGVKLENVRVAGAANSGIIFFTQALTEKGLPLAQMKLSALKNAALGTTGTLDIGSVPISLNGALVISSGTGIQTRFHQLGSSHGVRSEIKNAKVYMTNYGTAVNLAYTQNLTISDSILIAPQDLKNYPCSWFCFGNAVNGNHVTGNIFYENITAKGWNLAISLPQRGYNKVVGGHFDNRTDIFISTLNDPNRKIDLLLSDANFENVEADFAKGLPRRTIYLQTNFDPMNRDITTLFTRDIITMIGHVRYNGKQLYYKEQAADFVPFPEGKAQSYVPSELIGKTNQQMWDAYGLAIGETVAPQNAVFDRTLNALVGDPVTYQPRIYLASQMYIQNERNVQVIYHILRNDGKFQWNLKTTVPGPLKQGWNLVPVKVDGQNRTILIYLDQSPPEIAISKDTLQKLTVNPDDVKKGFTVTGTVSDDSTGSKPLVKQFSGDELSKKPVQTREDGTRFIELRIEVSDRAGNKASQTLELNLDDNKIKSQVEKRKQLPLRGVPKVLLYLLGFRKDRLLAMRILLPAPIK